MRRTKQSVVWGFYRKGDGIVTCNLCEQNFKFYGSTSTLKEHLRRKHFNDLHRKEQGDEEINSASLKQCAKSESIDLDDEKHEITKVMLSDGFNKEIVMIDLPAFSSNLPICTPNDKEMKVNCETRRWKPSIVWDYFRKGQGFVTCNSCRQIFKFYGSTSTLREHLKRKHMVDLKSNSNSTIDESQTNIQEMENADCTADPIDDVTSDIDENQLAAEFFKKTKKSKKSKMSKNSNRYSSTSAEEDILKVIADKLNPSSPKLKNATFGQYVAEQLESMRPDMAALCKKVIGELLYDGDAGYMTRYSRIVHDPPIFTDPTISTLSIVEQ